MRGLTVVLGLCLLLAPLSLLGQAEESGEVELAPIVVVGSPIVESTQVDRYAQEKVVIGEEQIDDLNAQDVTGALRRTPGVTISRYNMVGAYGGADGGAVYIRGMGQGRPGAELAVMFGGVPKSNSVWTHPLMDTVSVDVVERIEVSKSPQPVFIGNMSWGAVELVPKRLHHPGTRFIVGAGGGTYGTWFQKSEAGINDGSADAYFVQSVRESEGRRERSAGRVETYYVRLGYRFNENISLSVHALDTSSFGQDPGRKSEPTPKRSQFNVDNTSASLSLDNRFDFGGADKSVGFTEGYVMGYVDRGYINWLQEDKDTNTPWRNYGLRARQTLRLSGLELMGGVDGHFMGAECIEKNLDEANRRVAWELWHLWEPYAAVSYMLGDKDGFYLIPSYGHRWHQHSEFDNRDSWQAGVVLGYRDLEVHYNRARAWNYPGQYVRFFYQAAWTNFYEGDEFKDLKIEMVDHWEVGASYTFADRARVNFTWFEEEGRDKYVFVLPPPPPPMIDNLGKFSLSGYDASLVIAPTRTSAVYLGYSRIFVDKPERLPRAPESTFSAGANLMMADSVKISVDYQRVSEQYVGSPRWPGEYDKIDGYELLNAKLAWIIKDDKRSAELWVAGENLTSQKYEYQPDYPMPRQTWMGGASVSF